MGQEKHTHIDEDLERWARWRHVRSYGLGYPRDSTGKLMDGMRSTTCPDCRGEGRIPGHRVGSALAFIDPCPQCHGQGKVAGDFTADESSRTVKCKECKGRGEVNGTTCPPCRGDRKAHEHPPLPYQPSRHQVHPRSGRRRRPTQPSY